MYCTSCGKQIADEAVFCPYCGKPAAQGDALAELVTAARIGDQDAISALYEKTYSKVYYTVKSMIKDEDAVFDIVQDTYIKAFSHLDSFQGDTKFLPWVRQIAANTARDWLKKKRPMLFTELSTDDGQDTPVEDLFPDERSENLPEQVIDQKETKRLLREIIGELPEDQRAAIGMFYYEEISVKEIAVAMGVSESAVKSRLMYGRNKIEKKVRELEKQGTKLYSLSPLPFLLLLFRSQEAYAAEMPDSRILYAILASQPMETAAAAMQGAGTVGAAGTEAAGAAVAGTAAAAGGLGALKTGLITLAAVAVVGLGALGATRIFSHSVEPQEPPVIEDVTGSEESAASRESEIPAGSSAAESQPTDAEEETGVSYIFSRMPVAAYEVTGLGVGVNAEVYAEHVIIPEAGEDAGVVPFVKLDSSNTFVLFCLLAEESEVDEFGGYTLYRATIHSPSGSSQWEANSYSCTMIDYPEIEGYASGYPSLSKWDSGHYNEGTSGGSIDSLVDPWTDYLTFAEIYHPDAPREDTIYVLEMDAFYYDENYDETAEILAATADIFEKLGATNVREISVEEALKEFHIIVSEEGAD